MSTVIESLDSGQDPQQEVKQLQDLVKKLERQNEALRTRHNRTMSSLSSETSTTEEENSHRTPSPSPRIDLKEKLKIAQKIPETTICGGLEKAVVEELDIVDVFRELDDNREDSWLYISPKKLLPSQSKQSPYKWVRHEFERPSPEISSARKSLVFKIEEITSPRNNLAYRSMTPPSKQQQSSSASPLLTNGNIPSIRQPLGISPLTGPAIDTGTFTRPKKKKAFTSRLNKNDFNDTSQNDSREVSPEDAVDSDLPRPTNVSDIQALAKAQEDRLRQSYNSPGTSPRRNLRYSSKPHAVPPLALNDLDNSSPNSSNRSSPGRFDDPQYNPQLTRRLSKSKNSVASTSSHSSAGSNGSPTESPYSSQQHLDDGAQESPKVKSPNSQNGMRQVDSDSKLIQHGRSLGNNKLNSSTGQLNSRLTPGRPSSPALKSVGNTSPRRSTSPAGRSSIPRPGGSVVRTGIPAPRRSGIPSPRTSSNQQRRGDDSWKDGCY